MMAERKLAAVHRVTTEECGCCFVVAVRFECGEVGTALCHRHAQTGDVRAVECDDVFATHCIALFQHNTKARVGAVATLLEAAVVSHMN